MSNGTGQLEPNTEHLFSIRTPDGIPLAQPADNDPVQGHANSNGIEGDLGSPNHTASLEMTEQPLPERDPSPNLLSRRNVSGSSTLQRGIRATRPTADRTPPSPRFPSSPSVSHEGDVTQLTEPSNTLRVATPTAGEAPGPEGPMTPRNDAGPFVFDGSAGRASGKSVVASLAEAAAEDEEGRNAST